MTIATELLSQYIAAESAILQGQSVRFNDRILTRANLIEVQQGRREWQRAVDAENRIASGGTSVRFQTAEFT